MSQTETQKSAAPTDAKKEKDKDKKAERCEVEFESSLPLEEAVSYFEAIVAGLKKGTLHLRQGERVLTMNPPGHLDLEVVAARKKGRERISFELTWRTPNDAELTISTD